MKNILIDRIRISGLRGLKDFKMSLSETTVLTGMNNTGKTTVLKALQLALGSRAFLEIDDLHMSQTEIAEKIIVDIRIVQVGDNGTCSAVFDEDWEVLFKAEKIKFSENMAYVPLRTIVTYNNLLSKFDVEQQILNYWDTQDAERWQDIIGKKQAFSIEQLPFFYIDAQRDVVEDMKLKTSYLGKMLADVAKGYDPQEIETLERLIADLNEQTIDKSTILTTIKDALSGINSAMDNNSNGVELSPFSKKIRDLNKAISIHYGESSNSFTMDYHGMGTRSWSSLLTLKAFITHSCNLAGAEGSVFFPIIAIEEPESHLHPNAQKKLYNQMAEMPGQKIISTHSPYIAASADISEVNGLYKNDEHVISGKLNLNDFDDEEERKLRQKVINTKGELFFSKVLILFEGETEEQALPIFAEKYFGCHPSEIGIDFIGVGGAGQYLPFLRFAKTFNIPWFIFSDGETKPIKDMTNAVKKIIGSSFTAINNENNIVILDNNADFEKDILSQDYIEEIEAALIELNGERYIQNYIQSNNGKSSGRKKTNNICGTCNQNIYVDNIRNYSDAEGYKNALYDMMTSQKTKFGLTIAHMIVKSGKEIPQSVKVLFEKIKTKISHE